MTIKERISKIKAMIDDVKREMTLIKSPEDIKRIQDKIKGIDILCYDSLIIATEKSDVTKLTMIGAITAQLSLNLELISFKFKLIVIDEMFVEMMAQLEDSSEE